mmetsp:Transcript_70909/g.121812  ORF Transcript_70909/g.121812 Transcript_70909/m.121812 type:complete len:214 (+) Transcript_70909:336-977(+)
MGAGQHQQGGGGGGGFWCQRTCRCCCFHRWAVFPSGTAVSGPQFRARARRCYHVCSVGLRCPPALLLASPRPRTRPRTPQVPPAALRGVRAFAAFGFWLAHARVDRAPEPPRDRCGLGVLERGELDVRRRVRLRIVPVLRGALILCPLPHTALAQTFARLRRALGGTRSRTRGRLPGTEQRVVVVVVVVVGREAPFGLLPTPHGAPPCQVASC